MCTLLTWGSTRLDHVERYLREIFVPRIAPVSREMILCVVLPGVCTVKVIAITIGITYLNVCWVFPSRTEIDRATKCTISVECCIHSE
jgi:hypothetical protein